MARKIHVNPSITAATLEEALRASLPYAKRRRLEAMKLALEGKLTAADIARKMGVSRAQFFNWKKQGLNDLLHIERGGGRTSRLSPAIEKEIKRRINLGETPADVQFWLNRKEGIKIKTGGVYYYMKKLGFQPRQKRSHGTARGELKKRKDADLTIIPYPG